MWKLYIRLPALHQPSCKSRNLSPVPWQPCVSQEILITHCWYQTKNAVSQELLSAQPVWKCYPPFTHTLVLWLPSGKLPNLPHIRQNHPKPELPSTQNSALLQFTLQRFLYWQDAGEGGPCRAPAWVKGALQCSYWAVWAHSAGAETA